MQLTQNDLDASTHKPQRVYRVHLERELMLRGDSHGRAEDEKADRCRAAEFMEAAEAITSEADWYQRQIDSDYREAMNDPDASVKASVIAAVNRETYLSAFAGPKEKNMQPIHDAVATSRAGYQD